jgi:hypothetical protein
MDFATLRELVGRAGPFASVCFDSSHDTADAARQLDLRWRAIRDQLGGADAAGRTLTALDTAIAESPPATGRTGRALIAAGDTVLIDERLPDPPAGQIVRWSPLPYLLPLVEQAWQQVPHVVVVVDRTGADVRAVDEHGRNRAQHPVRGRERPVHKGRGGGWAHWNIQHRVDEVVHHHVGEVAREASRLVDAVGARVLVLAGEVQTRTALRDTLAPRAAAIAVETDAGTRAAGAEPEALDTEVGRVVAVNAETRRRGMMERFRAERGRTGGLAVDGLARTADELRAANVECLLVEASMLVYHTVWSGPEPTMLATAEQALREAGAKTIGSRRADEALPFAALAQGAEIVPVDDKSLPDGVGALLRHR